MSYSSLRLQNLRSYKDQTFELHEGVNIIIGPNGSGKTNLLEAVYFLNRLTSFRAADAHVVRFDQPWARIESRFKKDERTVKLTSENGIVRKQLSLAGDTKKRVQAHQLIPTVLFEPQHLRLMTGPPDLRRQYLDELGSTIYPDHHNQLLSYRRALLQRNRLLKQRAADDTLFVWDVKLAEYGAKIVKVRWELIEAINKHLQQHYRTISDNKERLEAIYNPSVNPDDYSSNLLKRLQTHIDQDRDYGFTSAGPHREDFSISINNQSAAVSASRGETRTLVLALKLIELELINAQHQLSPILLFDDVFSELDGHRRRMLTDAIKNHQTIITTTDADAIFKKFLAGAKVIPL